MKPSTDLWELVQSLTAHEKRYFKVHSSQHGGSQKYLLLFEAIEAQREYDELALKEQFREERFVRQFAVAKHYLYDLVLKTLRAYHAGSTVSVQLREILGNVEILNDKGLYRQALKVLDRGIALAREHERSLFLVVASLWQVALQPSLRASSERIAAHLDERNRIVGDYVNFLDYRDLMRRLSPLLADDYARSPEDLAEIERLMESRLLQDPEQGKTFQARLYFHWIHSTASYARNDFPSALGHAQAMVKLFDDNRVHRREGFETYLLSLGNTLALQRRCNDVAGFFRTIEVLESFRAELEGQRHLRSPRIAAEVFQVSSLYRLAFHVSRIEFSTCLDLIPEIEAGLDAYGEFLTRHVRQKFYSNLCYATFAQGELDRAIEYNNRILNDRLPVEGRQTYYASHLVALLLFFERGHIQLVEHRIESTRRLLASHNQIGPLEDALLNGFSRLVRAGNRDDERSVLARLRDDLERIAEDPVAQNGLRYFGYQPWIESRLDRRPFLDVVREMYERDGLLASPGKVA